MKASHLCIVHFTAERYAVSPNTFRRASGIKYTHTLTSPISGRLLKYHSSSFAHIIFLHTSKYTNLHFQCPAMKHGKTNIPSRYIAACIDTCTKKLFAVKCLPPTSCFFQGYPSIRTPVAAGCACPTHNLVVRVTIVSSSLCASVSGSMYQCTNLHVMVHLVTHLYFTLVPRALCTCYNSI